MEIIKDFDKIEAKGMDDFRSLPIGAYECVIMDARVNHNEQSGKDTFKVSVDIASGEFKDYFRNMYENDTRIDRKWNNNAVKYLSYTGDNVAYFKGFITTVENSNANYKWDWDETKLKGKKIGLVLGQEEYISQDGTTKLATKLREFRSIGKIDNIKIPKVKLLDGSYVDYEEYIERQDNPLSDFKNEMEISSDDLPF